MNKLKVENSELDLDKLCYDLAMAYAKTKFEYELKNNLIPYDLNAPEYLSETDHLMELFSEAFNEYTNYDIEYFKEKFATL